MKKFLIFVAVLALLAGGAKTVKADDGGPNSNFWFLDHKTNCISILNPETTGDNAFLVFDYSAKIGQALGKPWTIVKKGECYQVDDGTEEMFLVKIQNGNERTIFSNYNN